MSTTLDTANSLLTLTDVKEYLGVTGSTEDTRLNRLINSVSGRFNLYTRRKLKSRSITTYHDGDGGSVLYLDQYPVVSTATGIDIRVDVDRSYATTSKIGSTSIIIDSEVGKITLDSDSFDSGVHSVKIAYTAGYTVGTTSAGATGGTIPGELYEAALETVKVMRRREDLNRIDVRSESMEGASIQYESDLPWSVKQVLDLYKRTLTG